MKHVIILSLFIFTIKTSFAQYWFPVKRNAITYYQGNEKTIATYLTDSSITNEVKHYFTNQTLELLYESTTCWASKNSSWAGRYFTNINDTAFIFYNHLNKPILFKVNTTVNDTFTAFSDQKYTVVFKHLKDSMLQYNNQQDSLKIYHIAVLDKQQNPQMDNAYHNQLISISKMNGMFNTAHFYNFPYAQISSRFYTAPILQFVGNNQPTNPFKNLTAKAIFDYDLGDEFHHVKFNYNLMLGTGKPTETDTSKIILKVIDKTVFIDSMKYKFTRRLAYSKHRNGLVADSITNDTISAIYDLRGYTYLDAEPGVLDTAYNFLQSWYMGKQNGLNFKSNLTHHVYKKNSNDTCLKYVIDAAHQRTIFYEGAGIFYTGGDNMSNQFSFGHLLTYYKKGNKTWGTPWPENVGFQERNEQALLAMVYPNPNNGTFYVNLKNSEQAEFTVMDITGQIVYQKQVLDNMPIELKEVAKGLYFYTITQNNKQLTGKLLLAH